MIGQSGAIQMPVPAQNVFPNYWGHKPRWIVLHKTASGGSAQDIANFFIHDPNMASAHYIIGQDGTIVQCVSESDGAGANGVLEAGHVSYFDGSINPNLLTISIEHVDPTSDNSTPLTAAQKSASFKLIHDICQRHGIPMRRGDAAGGIIGHNDIAPIDRARCPGNYPWDELFAYLKGGPMVPKNWKDDGKTLTAPNGVKVVLGFRAFILNYPGGWDSEDWPVAEEFHSDPLEHSNPSLGAGQKLCFKRKELGYTDARGVFESWTGQEVYALLQELKKAQSQPAPTPSVNLSQVIASLRDAQVAQGETQDAIVKALAQLGIS